MRMIEEKMTSKKIERKEIFNLKWIRLKFLGNIIDYKHGLLLS